MTTPPTATAHAATAEPSLGAAHASIAVPRGKSWLRSFLAFSGPGYLVSVGYMDPGNWATSLSGGSQFGYTLLSVILLSNIMAIVLQSLCARLGIATGRDLAQACRDYYSKPVSMALWLICELAIIACDLAEVIGTAIALKLLFGIPMMLGAVITALDVFLLLTLMNRGFRWLEAFVISLLVVIFSCFIIEIALAQPAVSAILGGFFLPSKDIVTNPAMLYIAIGIIGATVMPHNLYLHSSLVQTRNFDRTEEGKKYALKWATIDSTLALMLALFVNASILIVAASVFHATGKGEVAGIEHAYELLAPALGVAMASTLFAVALLASGFNSTVTATLAGQIVMEGFLHIKLKPWIRRLTTRALAILPVIFVIGYYGEQETGKLLVLSQVVLSMQLPFAVIPLITFVSNKAKMGKLVISRGLAVACWLIAGIIVALNVKLLADTLLG
ncbi:MAG TPA: Nramp family divalent metal transporter [Patescibacteria group bacterium]|nr:Nramp family divalent metal transporter [Patescibacteria group bacterium]